MPKRKVAYLGKRLFVFVLFSFLQIPRDFSGEERKDTTIAKQLLRSATSVGANINEAIYGNSKADFISKLHISLKETGESIDWLTLLKRTNNGNHQNNRVGTIYGISKPIISLAPSKDCIKIFVVKGKPNVITGLDEGIFRSVHKYDENYINVVSEARFKEI